MAIDPSKTYIYHITDMANLPSIINEGGLYSDGVIRDRGLVTTEIGFSNIKQRRLNEYKVSCCGDRYVGEFVPFYFCPRSPMLYTINRGNTGAQPGCQKTILHLVSTVDKGMAANAVWAVSDGNAGAAYTEFSNDPTVLDTLNWEVIKSADWAGKRMHEKASEFLVADYFPLRDFIGIGCFDDTVAEEVRQLSAGISRVPQIKVRRHWYF